MLARLARWAGSRRNAKDFPFGQVVGHYRVRGRNYAHPELVAALREEHRRLRAPRAMAAQLLADWLPSTFDQRGGGYDSYLLIPMFERLAAAQPDTDVALDHVFAGLLADLTMTEGEALAADPGALRQRVRAHAALQALTRAGVLAPRARQVASMESYRQRSVGRDDPELAARAQSLARQITGEVPAVVQHAVRLSLLPTTPLHDEIMFIRMVQLFEFVFRQTFRCLERCAAALQEGDGAAAVRELDDATRRVAATPILYRILTTMPRSTFAVIRTHTDGRSAIQSRAYRQVERICAARPPGPADDKAADVRVPGPTLQEILAERGDPPRPVAAAILRLDDAWRAMKRTHWGITRKIIGEVPGTGGTSGASYLKQAAERPLFPMLKETG